MMLSDQHENNMLALLRVAPQEALLHPKPPMTRAAAAAQQSYQQVAPQARCVHSHLVM